MAAYRCTRCPNKGGPSRKKEAGIRPFCTTATVVHVVEEDEQQTRAPFFIREEEGEREIRFQSKLINMQFVIPRGGTRVVPLFLFFFLLSLALFSAASAFSSTGCTKMRLKIHTPRILGAWRSSETPARTGVYLKWMYRRGGGGREGRGGESRDETFSRHVASGRIIFDRVFLRVFSRCVPIGVLASRIERISERNGGGLFIYLLSVDGGRGKINIMEYGACNEERKGREEKRREEKKERRGGKKLKNFGTKENRRNVPKMFLGEGI